MNAFKNKYGELRGGWALAIAFVSLYLSSMLAGIPIGIMTAGIALANGGSMAVEDIETLLSSAEMTLLTQLLSVIFGIAVTLLVFKLLYRRPFPQMGVTSPKKPHAMKELLLGCVIGLGSISLVVGFLLLSGNGSVVRVELSALADIRLWAWLLVFAGVAFNEELLARGLMMTALKPTRNQWVILILPAALFALMHISNPSFSWLSAVNLFLIGLVFGVMFLRTGQLWLPIGFHFAWNFFQGNLWGVEVSGLRTPSLLVTTMTGPEWLTGGTFGAEGGVAALVCTLLLLAVMLFLYPKRSDAQWSLGSDLPLVRVGKYAALSAEPVSQQNPQEDANP